MYSCIVFSKSLFRCVVQRSLLHQIGTFAIFSLLMTRVCLRFYQTVSVFTVFLDNRKYWVYYILSKRNIVIQTDQLPLYVFQIWSTLAGQNYPWVFKQKAFTVFCFIDRKLGSQFSLNNNFPQRFSVNNTLNMTYAQEIIHLLQNAFHTIAFLAVGLTVHIN